ncbi:MAG: ubiquinol-cytochrome c reductase iron-sulfur subunit [Candidatus Magnetoovum sp. WYHC-5]|nr:ubiquinol-cytochrome c reductase iron-sulfur subunit [Candidatus Magnetoovum sp. WYHC-5]
MDRRIFLKKIIKTFFFSVGIITSSLSVLFIYPSNISRRKTVFFDILAEDELPRKGVKRVDFTYKHKEKDVQTGFYIVADKGSILGLSPVCSHLGCLVKYNNHEKAFICPCHGGKYDIRGQVTDGPPPKPLTELPLKIADGRVYVGIKV